MLLLLKIILLIVVANAAPVLMQHLLPRTFLSRPIDNGLLLSDQYFLFGPAKTWGGIFASLSVTPVAAFILGIPATLGFIIAALAMLGDLLSSFIKRRLGYQASSQAIGLDQIPESLLPLLYVTGLYEFPFLYLLIGVAAFVILELVLSRITYKLGIRKHPY